MKKTPKLIITTIVIAIICLALYLKITKKDGTKAYHKTSQLKEHKLSQYITATGTLKALDQFTIGSLEAGRVISIFVDDNDHVKKDQVLAILDNGIGDSNAKRLQAQLVEARARLDYQTKFFERQKSLYESGQLAQDLFEKNQRDYIIEQSTVKQVEASLEIEEKKYQNLSIKAPDDGIIIAKNIEIGQMITSVLSATVLFMMAKDLTKMEAEVDVDEADVGLLKKGLNATFSVDSFPRKQFSSRIKEVRYLSKTVNNVISYPTILEVDNPTLQLRPGMTTNVEIIIAENQRGLSLPNQAFRINKTRLKDYAEKNNFQFKPLNKTASRSDDTLDTVWVAENNIIKEAPVSLGLIDERYSEIKKGLTEADNVIIELFNPTDDAAQFLQRMFKGGR